MRPLHYFAICTDCATLGNSEIVGPGAIQPQPCAICGLPKARGRTDGEGSRRAWAALCEKLEAERKVAQ